MISIIIPVYNVEDYLERCVKSVLAQDYNDYELILVDDGSTDSSGQMCDEFVSTDSRIKVFHKKNGGLSDARNYGIKVSLGDYLTFIDSDDYIGPQYLSILIGMMNDDMDITVIKMKTTNCNSYELVDSGDNRECFQSKSAFCEMLKGTLFGVSACGKLFRRVLFNNYIFPKGLLFEDARLIPYIFMQVKNIGYSSSAQYYYFQRSGSIIHNVAEEKEKQFISCMEELYQYTEKEYPKAHNAFICRYIKYSFSVIINELFDHPLFVKKCRAYVKMHKEWWQESLKNPYLGIKMKAKIMMLLIHPSLYRKLYKLYK